ncbi:FANCM protein, partial [Climacteris rufus]|nr:FANCM protein [Climacteris rufus]
MRGVYLSSVRSPALGSRYKMVHREFNSSAIFSQIPEQDTAYAEDSFCVGDEEEEAVRQSGCSEEEEECVDFALLSSEGPRLTRRRTRLQPAGPGGSPPVPVQRRKLSRIVVLSDSSEEEAAGSREKPLDPDCPRAQQGRAELPSAPSVQRSSVAGGAAAPQPGGKDWEAAEAEDLQPEQPGRSTSFPPAVPGSGNVDLQAPGEVQKKSPGSSSAPARAAATTPPSGTAGLCRGPDQPSPALCILADSREICSAPGVISCLRAEHGLGVHVCPLGSSDYVVSTRLAVERLLLSELLSPGNRSRLRERLRRLQAVVERICVIVETDRTRPGETSRLWRRTQYYDGILSGLVQAGIRILFSSCQEETAALLQELAVLEHRKGRAIPVPPELQGHGQAQLRFYLSIPGLSYAAALGLCRSFRSVAAVPPSSAPALAAGARLSLPRAEELLRFLRHRFDPQLLPQPLPARGKS